jgi:hypothetical protein
MMDVTHALTALLPANDWPERFCQRLRKRWREQHSCLGHLNPHAVGLDLDRKTTQIPLPNVIEAFATIDFKAGGMQGALHHAILDKALGQQGIGMRAHILQSMDLVLEQKQTYFLTLNDHTGGKVGVQARTRGHVVPDTWGIVWNVGAWSAHLFQI